MRQLVTLSLMEQQSASERLRGVSWAYRAEPSDTDVLDALVHGRESRFQCERPAGCRGRSADLQLETRSARDAVANALSGQSDPIVQVALIDLLVDLKETGAAPELGAWPQTTGRIRV